MSIVLPKTEYWFTQKLQISRKIDKKFKINDIQKAETIKIWSDK